MVRAAAIGSYFEKTGASNLFYPRGVFVELRLNDLIQAAVDGREAFVHLGAEAA
jgi:hypothetical protein